MKPVVFSHRRANRYRVAFGVVAALFCAGGIAHAQRPVPVVTPPVRRTQPVPIFHLDAADVASSRAELQSRMMKSFAASGRTLTPKPNGVLDVKQVDQDALKSLMTPEQQKAAAEKAKQKAEAKKKKAAEKAQAEEDAKIQAAVEKALAEYEAKDKAAQSASEAAKFNVSLSAKQPESPDGNAYVNFMAPKSVSVTENLVVFQNMNEYLQPGYYGQLFVPESYMVMGMYTKVGKTYLVTANVSYFGGGEDNTILIYNQMSPGSPNLLSSVNWYLLAVGSNVESASFVVKAEKEGWYPLYFAGKKNEWKFRGLTIKEITP